MGIFVYMGFKPWSPTWCNVTSLPNANPWIDHRFTEWTFHCEKETEIVACNELFICLLLVSKRNRMMNSPLYCRKNWGLPSSIHWSYTSICNLPPPSWIQNTFKFGLFSSQRNQYDVLLSQFPVCWYTDTWLHVHLGEVWTFEKHAKSDLKWDCLDFNWFL